jgi:hypothetical protein
MKAELYAIIISELNRQARTQCKGLKARAADECLHKYVQKTYLHIGGILNMELTPYFHPDFPCNEHEGMRKADLEVLVTIAEKLGFKLEINWTR